MTHPLIILSLSQQAARECLHPVWDTFILRHTEDTWLEGKRSSQVTKVTCCSSHGTSHRHRIHANRWRVVGLNSIVGSIVRPWTVQGITSTSLTARMRHLSSYFVYKNVSIEKNKCTSCEQDRNKTPTVIKHNNKYLNMTSICAILTVSFGWETLTHSLKYQLIKR